MNVSKFILKYHWPYNRGRYLTSHIETNTFKIFNTKYPCLLQYKLGLHRPIHSIIIIKDVSKCFIRSYGHFANFKNEKRSNNKHTNFTNQILHWSTMSVILAAGIYFGLLFKKIVAIPLSFTLYAASPIFKEKIEEKGTTEYQKNVSNQLSGSRFKYNFIADVVDKVSDGVVFIEIKDHRRKDMSGQNLSMSNGSGFIVDPDGLILTNAHVVANKPRASTIKVRLSDGREFVGKIEDFDAISDLALVRIQCTGLNPLIMGSSKDVRPGEFVVALGSPLSLANTITSGVVSSIGRASKDLGLQGKDIQYIQTDAAITFGNSGGPLVNLDGEVIAINSMKVTSGISFAIPIDYAKEFLEKIKKKKTFMSKFKKDDSQEESLSRRRYLGITMLSLSTEVISQMQQRGPGNIIPSNVTHGILIWRIVVGSPAYHAGLEPGDIVTHINGHEIHSSRDVYKLLESKSDLRLVINRKGERYNVSVTPEE